MTNKEGIVTEVIGQTIAIGLSVCDTEDEDVGQVVMIDRLTGYCTVQARPLPEKMDNPFAEKLFYVPFRLITNIDPRELQLSVSLDELNRDYVNPPSRSTFVREDDGREVAVTKQRSGYTDAPILVHRDIEHLKNLIAVGDHVYTSDMVDLGAIKRYDPVTGWMLVKRGLPPGRHDLMIPAALAENVNTDLQAVYLVISEADLERKQHLEPVDLVFPEATVRGWANK